jgi:hypothetical protein
MKKLYSIVLFFCLLFANNAWAQDAQIVPDNRDRLMFGVKAGMNLANVWDEEGESFEADPVVGFAGGLFLGIPLGKLLGLQPEVLISQKGLQGRGILLGSPYSFTRTTTYVDVPLQLQLKPVSFLTLVGGPQFSFLVHERTSYTYGSNSSQQEQEFNNDDLRRNILGFAIGGDILVSRLVISGRVGWDFQANNGDGSSYYTPRYKNQWLQLTLGFKIP